MWKVGQTVWCILRGAGRVEEVSETQVCVRFSNHPYDYGVWFYLDGRVSPKFNRSLFFSEPKIDAAVVPPFEPKLKRGTPIIICNKAEGFVGALFGYIVEEFEKTIKVTAGEGETLNWDKDRYDFLDPTGLTPVKFN